MICLFRILRSLSLPAEMQCKELSRSSTLWHNRKVSIAIHSEWITVFSLCMLLFLKMHFILHVFPFILYLDYRRIQSAFSLCKTPSTPKDIHQLNGFLRNAFTMMAMLDYPYSTHFMGSMPAFPVKVLDLSLA